MTLKKKAFSKRNDHLKMELAYFLGKIYPGSCVKAKSILLHSSVQKWKDKKMNNRFIWGENDMMIKYHYC